jgi:hypothetical protein
VPRTSTRSLKTGQPQAPKPRVLPPAFRAHMFKPGQTGNPGGFSADIAAVRRLARENSIEALQQIVTLMRTAKDERVRLVAADKVLERAFGKPKEEDPRDRPPMDRQRILELLRYAATLEVPEAEAEVVDVTPGEDKE